MKVKIQILGKTFIAKPLQIWFLYMSGNSKNLTSWCIDYKIAGDKMGIGSKKRYSLRNCLDKLVMLVGSEIAGDETGVIHHMPITFNAIPTVKGQLRNTEVTVSSVVRTPDCGLRDCGWYPVWVANNVDKVYGIGVIGQDMNT